MTLIYRSRLVIFTVVRLSGRDFKQILLVIFRLPFVNGEILSGRVGW